MNELKENTELQYFRVNADVETARHNILGITEYGTCAENHTVYTVTVGMQNTFAPFASFQFCKCFSAIDLSDTEVGDEIYLCPPQIVKPLSFNRTDGEMSVLDHFAN